jgi:hypothetical protein
MTQKSSRRRFRRLGCLVVFIALIGVGTLVLSYVWPIFVYPPLLLSLPTPPGYVPGSLHFGGAGLDFRGWERIYDVDQPYEEAVDFFKAKLAKRGWRLIQDENGMVWSPYFRRHIASTTLVFHGPYFLSFDIQIEVDVQMEQGEQIGTARVFIYDRVH